MDTPTPWHTFSGDEALQRLQAGAQGLSADQVRQRQRLHGSNVLAVEAGHALPWIFLRQFADFMIVVLLAAVVVSALIGEPRDTLVIIVILLLNAIIGTLQEFRAERAVTALRKLAAPTARVMRAGRSTQVAAGDLVPGDIVLLAAGDVVPADLRLLQAAQLQIDEAALTGESLPVNKQSAALAEPSLPPADCVNLAYKTSLVTRGSGCGVVYATGLQTQVGRISALLRAAATTRTPLQLRLARFGRYLALAVLAICGVVFFAGLLQGQAPMLMLLTAVSLAVAAIPEALPAVVTISLALGARRLVANQVLVRNLPAVETLGSVTFICADKTGTLTQNRMRAERYVSVAGEVDALPASGAPWRDLAAVMLLNNDLVLLDDAVQGEPTEAALYQAAQAAGYDPLSLRQALPRQAVIAFDSERQRMTTLHDDGDGVLACVKGAPEKVLPLCAQALTGDGVQAFDATAMVTAVERLAADGYRVLALAQRRLPAVDNDAARVERELSFLGLVALIDPPRPEVPQAVADCRRAGITPVMITGDHPGTARAIAARLGISDDGRQQLTGRELERMDDAALARVARDIRVYARVTPEQKLRIVQALQARGEFVAMTGDGVNDAPALRQAGIGVAMGMKGTDVARQAADMVLLDDNFASIVQAVRAGRRIYDNIRKFIKDTMSSNSGEIWTLFLAPLCGLPIPLLPIHILWINLITDGLPGLAFAAEPAEADLMQRPPRPPQETIFAHGMWQHILWVGLFVAALSLGTQVWALQRGVDYWQTMVFTVLTVSQLFHSLAVRGETLSLLRIGITSNRPMLLAIAAALLLQLLLIYHPLFNELFHTRPLPLPDLAFCLLLSSLVLLATEGEKWLRRKTSRRRP